MAYYRVETLHAVQISLIAVKPQGGINVRAKTCIPSYALFSGHRGIGIGVAVGFLFPETAQKLKPLGDAFIKLIKMMIAPIIFCTVVVGIAKMGHMRDVGGVGIKALVYFEAMSTIALIIGLVVVNVLQPGAGINADPATLDTKAIASYATAARSTPPKISF